MSTRYVSSTGYTFEPNNQVPYLNTEGIPSEYHTLMGLLAQSSLAFCLSEAPDIQTELVEEFWDSAELSKEEDAISFTCKQKGYTLTLTDIHDALHLPANTCDELPSKTELRNLLKLINYANLDVNLGEAVRKT